VVGCTFLFLGSAKISGITMATITVTKPHNRKMLRHPSTKAKKPDDAKASGIATSPAALPSPRAFPLFLDSNVSDRSE